MPGANASRIVHIALKVDDLEGATRFYEEAFGFREVRTERVRDHVSRHLSDGATDLALVKYDADATSAESGAAGDRPCIHHFGVEVDDLGEAEARIRGYGCEIVSDPGVVPVKFRAPGGTLCEIVPRGRYARPGPKRNLGDLGSALVLGSLGLYVIGQARQWEYLTPNGPGAGFFPLWYGVAMVALAAVLLASGLRRRGTAAGARLHWNRIARALTGWLALAASVVLSRLVGFVLSFALLTFFLVAVMYRRPWKVAAAVAAASALAFYLLFPVALGVPLPAGILGF
jgi:catechol 2,3-dioxygenase-like lactoylglutathione lyase family enzyme